MARELLGDGRADDVMEMIDPLLEPVGVSATGTGQLLLHTLRARIDIVHWNRPERALDRLPPRSQVEDLCTCVQAELALWRGWARARYSSAPSDSTRALHHLQQAEGLFDSIHDSRGRCWAFLGQAQAYFHLEEYGLMRPALADANRLRDHIEDRQADRWSHELCIPALRFDGRYEDAERHLHALRTLGREWNDHNIRGRATAHEAALHLDLGRPPADVIDTAETAETLLRRVDDHPRYPFLLAYHAHVGALFRQGRWADAHAVLDDAEDAIREEPAQQTQLLLLRARIALRRDKIEQAEEHLDSILEHASHLPHGLHRSPIALLRGRVLARRNKLDAAYTWMQRAHRNARETGHRGRQLQTLLTLARTAAARSELDTAQSHLNATDAYEDYVSVLPFAVRRFATEGTIAQTSGAPDEAIEAYQHALAAASIIQDRFRTASLQLALAQLEGSDRAQALASAAQSTFEDIDAPDQAKVASTLAPNTDDAADASETPSPLPYTSSSQTESTIARSLVHASLSVPLVANTWLQAAAALLPDRWLGIYRISEVGIATALHERGERPDGLQLPSGQSRYTPGGPAEWMYLHDSRPTLALGVEKADDDPGWTTARRRLDTWRPLLQLAFERAQAHQQHTQSESPEMPGSPPVEGLITESAAMDAVVEDMRRSRVSARPVLITGESGTGKQLLARALHAESERADGPIEQVSCETMQRNPLAERLFGHADPDGAFTPGAIHEADGGTLLLEDIDALSLSAQDTLLHFFRTGEVLPEGGTNATPVDVRVMATTDGPLEEAVRNDHVRPALHHQMTLLSFNMPALRERRADIPFLVRHFLDKTGSGTSATGASITQPAMEALLRYEWPGNVRQLRNEVERALVYVESEPAQTINRDMLLDHIVAEAQSVSPSPDVDEDDAILHPDRTLSDVLSQTEASVIKRVLRACDGQVTSSAEVLGLSRQGLYKKMKRLGIDASDFQPDPEPAPSSS